MSSILALFAKKPARTPEEERALMNEVVSYASSHGLGYDEAKSIVEGHKAKPATTLRRAPWGDYVCECKNGTCVCPLKSV
jgi:hypothetical protein